MMPVNYTNRKGLTYTLYRGQTRTSKPRYYFSRTNPGQGELVTELPPGFTISESVNGVVSLVKDRPALIHLEEVAIVEAEVKLHPKSRQYRVVVKQNRIEIYEQINLSSDALLDLLPMVGRLNAGLIEQLQSWDDRYAQYMPVLRFILFDSEQRRFSAERMCYRSSIDGWLKLTRGGSIAELAHALVPTLDTDAFYELW